MLSMVELCSFLLMKNMGLQEKCFMDCLSLQNRDIVIFSFSIRVLGS